MYLPSKIRSKSILFFVILTILLFLPLREFFSFFITSCSQRLMMADRDSATQLQELKKKNLTLLIQLHDFKSLQEENAQLRSMLNFVKKNPMQIIGGEIIAFRPSAWERVASVNVGQNRGVSENAFTLNEEGKLIGQIINVKKKYSLIRLIQDPDFTLPVFIGQNALGLLKGGLDGIKIRYVEKEAHIQVGDPVWMKLSTVAVPMQLGVIKRVRKNPHGLFLDIDVALLSDGSVPHKVFILK